MKKMLTILTVLMVLSLSTVLGALEFTLDNYEVTVPQGGTVYVTLTALDNSVPVPGVVLSIVEYCRETTDPEYKCNSGDLFTPGEVGVGVTTPTDVNGEATVTITHDGSNDFGKYHYTVCDVGEGSCGVGAANVTGDFFIPEMGIISAMVVLAGAGLFIARKRK